MSRRHVFWAIALLAVAAAFAQAWALRWTCDDAYISFRYAEHFVEGHGLVFNRDPGEAPVEGYTNFAWTMWLALGMLLGFTGDAIEGWASFWGAACHGGTVFLLASMAWRASGGRAVVPIAACGFAAVHHAASLAPAGLETAMFTLLVTATLRFAMYLKCVRESWLLGFLGVLLAMTRPDGGLFVAIVGLFVLFDARRRRASRLLMAYVVPFAVTFLPYLIWRRLYYGYWVPNTFYAKSAGDPYPSQGLVYVWEFFKCYWALLPVIAAPLWFVVRKPDLLATVSGYLGRRPHVAVLAFVLPYVAFVIWVGGDFMFGRFLVPILPALLLGLDIAANRWRAVWLQPALAVALVVGLLLRAEPTWLADYKNPRGFSDNRAISLQDFHPGLPLTEAMRLVGHKLREVFADSDVRIAIVGSQASLAYRTKAPVVIECATGLTDARLAHQEIRGRGTVGHEKGYRRLLDYVIFERKVQITFDLDYLAPDLTNGFRNIMFDVPGITPPMPARLMYWDRELMQRLAERGDVHFLPFEQVLDDYIADLENKTKPLVRKNLEAFRKYYFDHNDDPERLRRLEDFVQ